MPNLTELLSEPFVLIAVVAIVITGLMGWLYASQGVRRRVVVSRVLDDGEPTRPIARPVVDDIDTPTTTTPASVRTTGLRLRERRARRPRTALVPHMAGGNLPTRRNQGSGARFGLWPRSRRSSRSWLA